ncbi:hypothetical protein GEMRC1_004723 [Eukaryota sp. GEM-RC1]
MSSREQKRSSSTRFYEGGTILPFNLGKCPAGGCLVNFDNQSIEEYGPFDTERLEEFREMKHLGHRESGKKVIYEGGRMIPEELGGGKAPPGGVEIDLEDNSRTFLDPERARSKGYHQ